MDAVIDPAEIAYAEGLAGELLGTDGITSARLVRESLQRVASEGPEAVRASLSDRLPNPAEREVAYLAANGAIYRDGRLAHREAGSLAELARSLDLDRATVDRLSTDEPLVLGALYPEHWRLAPATPPGHINEALEDWADRGGLLRDPRAVATMRSLDLETCQRFVFPRCADRNALLWGAKYTLWLYLFDDVVEHFTAAGMIGAARAFVAPCLAVPRSARAASKAHVLIRTFAELTRELYERSSDPDLPSKWERCHRDYWELGILSEVAASARAGDPLHGLRHHLRTRPWASGVQIYFDIGEVICDAQIPKELRQSAELDAIRYLGALIGGVFNDLLSYDKEKPFDNLANTALALRREFQLDDRGALTYSITWHDELVRDCDRRIEELALSAEPTFTAYADMLRQLLHGFATWQLLSRRYLNRHSVVLSTGDHQNPRIDPDRVETLRHLAVPPSE